MPPTPTPTPSSPGPSSPGPATPATHPGGSPRAVRPVADARRGLRRDRRGRGMRGRLVPSTVPLSRSRSQMFDELVLDAVEDLEGRWAKGIADVEFAVEDVPPELPAYDADVLDDGSVPLARLLPSKDTGRGRRAPARIVVYRRPLEARALDREDLADLVRDVVTEQVANLLGLDPDEVDPD